MLWVFLKILFSFISVSLLGGLLGLGLAYAAKRLHVEKDERILQAEDLLPSYNCGACGYSGCAAYAEAVVLENEDLTLCAPGGGETAQSLASLLGKEVETSDEHLVAQVHCRGGRETAQYRFEYHGIQDCNALHLMFKGNKSCEYGCLGMGSCIKVCPVDAISYDKEGLIWIDRDLCIACGKCLDVCPTGVIKMIPYDADYIVACNSPEKGKFVKKSCSVGCIGCKLCERKFGEAGYQVENNLASIDYKAQGNRAGAAGVCPTKCIIPVKGDRRFEVKAEKTKK